MFTQQEEMRSFYLIGSLVLFLSAVLMMHADGRINPMNSGPSLKGATTWINSKPLDLSKLKGKVVLIDFWTYTCINWRRTLPYIQSWAEKYKDHGLLIVGVHTPEFSFEHKIVNINDAITGMKITYPVAVDNNYEIWNSFQNQYWPALYLIDEKGIIRYTKFGEGNYAEAEKEIQKLLREAGHKELPTSLVTNNATGYEAEADWDNLRSHETFLGYERTEHFASPESMVRNKSVQYSVPAQLGLNYWALSGEWNIGQESVTPSASGGAIHMRFHARDLNMIMASSVPGKTVRFRVLINGKPPGPSQGLDIDEQGYGVAGKPLMYQLIRQQGVIKDSLFEIEFYDPEIEIYDITFG